MLIKLLKTTKYKKKMLFPGTHDVIQKSAKAWIKLGIAVEVKDKKETSVETDEKEKSASDILADGQLAELQAAAEILDIDFEGKTYEELLEEVNLAKALDLDE